MIWTILYWFFLVLALVVGLRAWFWDRAGFRGRPEKRCKKCWYDLTGAPGDVAKEAIRCPECGKEHKTKRSMRKTRRSRRLVMVAILLWAGSYAAGVWPRVSMYNFSNGVYGAVPTPVLILALPILPDDAGTKIDRNSGGGPFIPIPQRPMAERIAHQLMIRLHETEDTSWLDHWLFIRMAKRESAHGLTDPTSIRGDTYRYVFQAWDRQRRLSIDEERWAKTVHQLEIEHAEYGIQSEPAYANIRIRRLLDQGRWRVRVHKTLYERDRHIDWKTYAGFYELEPVDLQQHGWWDGSVCIYDMIVMNNSVWWGSTPPTTFERAVSGTIYDGDPYMDIWWPAVDFDEKIEINIAGYTHDGVIDEVSSAEDQWVVGEPWIDTLSGANVIQDPEEYISWIRTKLRVRFTHDEDSLRGEGLPERLSLSVRNDYSLKDKLGVPPFTFGGTIKVIIQTQEGGRYEGPAKVHTMVVMESEDAWWALRDEVDKQGLHVFEGNWKKVKLKVSHGFEHYERHGGVFTFNGPTVAVNDETIGGYVEIRFGGEEYYRGGFRALADLETKQLLTAPVRLPLSRSEADSIKRAVQSSTYRIGYKDLYSEEELAEIEETHQSRTWLPRPEIPNAANH